MNAQYGIAYGLLINFTALILMAHDKSQARKNRRRIPEKTLFLVAALGGSIGSIAGMRAWRHKTKHFSFVFGMPAILVLQLILLYFYFEYL
jgi:uncharacterized membrane protein YsdA (DUF1294 family)